MSQTRQTTQNCFTFKLSSLVKSPYPGCISRTVGNCSYNFAGSLSYQYTHTHSDTHTLFSYQHHWTIWNFCINIHEFNEEHSKQKDYSFVFILFYFIYLFVLFIFFPVTCTIKIYNELWFMPNNIKVRTELNVVNGIMLSLSRSRSSRQGHLCTFDTFEAS